MFVSNDWHAALVPSYLAAKYRRHGVYQARPLLAQACEYRFQVWAMRAPSIGSAWAHKMRCCVPNQECLVSRHAGTSVGPTWLETCAAASLSKHA